jgi:hypothetical protein
VQANPDDDEALACPKDHERNTEGSTGLVRSLRIHKT